MPISIQKTDCGWQLCLQNDAEVYISTPVGCTDSFQILSDCAVRWIRKTDAPTDRMKLTLQWEGTPRCN